MTMQGLREVEQRAGTNGCPVDLPLIRMITDIVVAMREEYPTTNSAMVLKLESHQSPREYLEQDSGLDKKVVTPIEEGLSRSG